MSAAMRSDLSRALLFLATAHLLLSPGSLPAQSSLAILNAGVQQSEDAAFVSPRFAFFPGEFIHVTFQIAGFTSKSGSSSEARKISLKYQVAPQDTAGTLLAKPVDDSLEAELNPEDKDWTPKRRASFQIPPFVAAGDFRIHVTVEDLNAKTDTSADLPFHIGGVEVQHTSELSVQNFVFLRNSDDKRPLEVPAYAPGDHIYTRFDMTGYKLGPDNSYHLEYGLLVLRPDGKPYIEESKAAELENSSFYPAQFVPGNLNLTTSANSARGQYVIVLTVHDLIGNQQLDFKRAFSIE
jgi:hypothetical protein